VVRVGQDHDVLDRRQLGAVFQQHRQEAEIGEDDPVFSVVDDVAELLGEQARVERVADRPDAHDPVPGLDMAAGVPGQRRDPVARQDAEPQQGVGHPLGAGVDRGIAGADDRPLDRAADDFAVAVPGLGVVEDLVDRQRPVLHQPVHIVSSRRRPFWARR
jgi:hypothetical protein